VHDIHNETTPISLHVLGEAPPRNLMRPWIVTCLGKRFRDSLNEVVEVPAEEALNPGDKQKYLRKKSEEIVTLLLEQGFSPQEAVQSVVEKTTHRRVAGKSFQRPRTRVNLKRSIHTYAQRSR